MTFNASRLWIEEIGYHTMYVSICVYSETDVGLRDIRDVVRHLGGVDRASQALIRWQFSACFIYGRLRRKFEVDV